MMNKLIVSLLVAAFVALSIGCTSNPACDNRLSCGVYTTDEAAEDCAISYDAARESLAASESSKCAKLLEEFDKAIDCEAALECKDYLKEQDDCWEDYNDEWADIQKDGDTDECFPYDEKGGSPSSFGGGGGGGDDDDSATDDDDSDVDYYQACDQACNQQTDVSYSECMDACCSYYGC
ncbi:MAG: hypothetical protein Kow0090_05870 [Myxococcota bacterium]